jgi:hypothetical protein
MRPFFRFVVWLIASLAPGFLASQPLPPSILVIDQSDIRGPYTTAWFSGLNSAMTRSAAAGISFLFAVLLACSPALAAESKRVMLLHSFGSDFRPWSEYAKAMRAELARQSPWQVDIIEQSLVTARFSDDNPEAPFVEYLRALFAKHPLDLIVSIGAPAANFVQRHRERLFATTPMVLMAVDHQAPRPSDARRQAEGFAELAYDRQGIGGGRGRSGPARASGHRAGAAAGGVALARTQLQVRPSSNSHHRHPHSANLAPAGALAWR